MNTQARFVVDLLSQHRAELAALGVHTLGLYGSTVRGEATPESDVDLVVEFETGKLSYDRLFDLRSRLEQILGKRIDLITMGALRSPLRERILTELIRAA